MGISSPGFVPDPSNPLVSSPLTVNGPLTSFAPVETQLMQQPVPQPMQQPVPQPMVQPVLQQPVEPPLPVPQPVPQVMQQPVEPQVMQQPVEPQVMQQPVQPQPMPQIMPQPVTQVMQQPMQQPVPQVMQQSVPQVMQQPMPQPVTQVMQQPMQQPGIRRPQPVQQVFTAKSAPTVNKVQTPNVFRPSPFTVNKPVYTAAAPITRAAWGNRPAPGLTAAPKK